MLNFTLAQLRLYSTAAARRQAEAASLMMALTRIAVWGKGDEVDKTKRALEAETAAPIIS